MEIKPYKLEMKKLKYYPFRRTMDTQVEGEGL